MMCGGFVTNQAGKRTGRCKGTATAWGRSDGDNLVWPMCERHVVSAKNHGTVHVTGFKQRTS